VGQQLRKMVKRARRKRYNERQKAKARTAMRKK
jgi:hypothetical protein